MTAWQHRHPSLGEVFRNQTIKTAVEIGVARGGLAHYLLENVAGIEEYHGIDPFIGGYDDNDFMSKLLKQVNASERWTRAVLRGLAPFGCRFRLHQNLSIDAVVDFKGVIMNMFSVNIFDV